MMLRWSGFTLVFLLFSSAAVAQQAPATETPSTGVPKIVKQTQLVYVPVVVNDKHGQHISGLTKDSFKVEQDGHSQTIATFEEVTHTGKVTRRPSSFPEGSGYIENFAATPEEKHRLLIVVLDLLNTPFLAQHDTRKQLLKFLSGSLPADQPISLMVLTANGLQQVHPFTTDTSVLIAAVKKVESRLNMGESADAELDAALGDPNDPNSANSEAQSLFQDTSAQQYDRFVQMNAARTTLLALEQLSGAYAGIAGRKTVIWASGGFPFLFTDPQSLTGLGTDFLDEYDRSFRLLNNANMAIYAVDVNGLVAPTSRGSMSAASSGPGGPRGNSGPARGRLPNMGQSPGAPRYNVYQQKQDALRAFADATGGKVFMNTNDFTRAFAAAADDAGAYYILGYYLKGDDKPGWHKLKVHVEAEHADVRARDGFLIPAPEHDTPKSRLMQLAAAAASPADYTGLHFGIRLSIKPADAATPPTSNRRLENIRISLPAGVTTIDGSQDNFISLDYLVVVFLKDRELGERPGSVRLNAKPELLSQIQQRGLGFTTDIELPPGEYELCVALRDNLSGNLGTVRTKLKVE